MEKDHVTLLTKEKVNVNCGRLKFNKSVKIVFDQSRNSIKRINLLSITKASYIPPFVFPVKLLSSIPAKSIKKSFKDLIPSKKTIPSHIKTLD